TTTTRRWLLNAAGTALLALSAVVPLQAQAQDIKERNLKFALSLAKDHPLGVGAQKFADLVSARSGGKIKITVYPAAMLGSDPQNLSAARGGTVDFTTMATGLFVGLHKDFMLFDFPFLFNDAQEAYALADGPVGRKLQDKLPEYGLVGLGLWDLGFRNMTNSKRPIEKYEDLAGLKLRVLSSPIYIDLFNTLGANPVPMTFGELYMALESKTVDGQDNPVGVIENAKFAEVQKYLSLTRHVYTAMPVVMSKKTWDGMSAAEHKIISEAAREAMLEQRKISQSKELQSIGQLKAKMQVNEVSPGEIARLRDKVKPVVDKYSKEVSEALVAEANAELAKMRGAK
ncbi:TRAP transporter substrate-binding protein, partial [Aquincola sp. MAHUQ-54]